MKNLHAILTWGLFSYDDFEFFPISYENKRVDYLENLLLAIFT